MAGDLEKPSGTHSRASSHGESTDDYERKAETEGQATQVSSGEAAALDKTDSHIVKVKDKDEDLYAHLPPA